MMDGEVMGFSNAPQNYLRLDLFKSVSTQGFFNLNFDHDKQRIIENLDAVVFESEYGYNESCIEFTLDFGGVSTFYGSNMKLKL